MKSLLILPAVRPGVSGLARQRPLALSAFVGQTVLGHALTDLAEAGAKEVFILAADRPAQVREWVGKGESWGLKITVYPEPLESSVERAREKHPAVRPGDWLPAPWDVFVLDRLPSLSDFDLWQSYAAFFNAQLAFMSKAARVVVGCREASPRVWLGLRSQISPQARLRAPVWIGSHVWVGPGATVGPDAVIEKGSYVDQGAEVSNSLVLPRTYVGAMTRVRDSIAAGRDLINIRNGSVLEVPDSLLMADLSGAVASRGGSWLGRLLALLTLVLTSPVLLLALLRKLGSSQPLFTRREVVLGGVSTADALPTAWCAELTSFQGLARRWPQLWSVVRGDFAWVGNRPLSAEQAGQLAAAYERLWLACPTGLVSLADAMGCTEEFGDEARMHASFYAVDPAPRKALRTLTRFGRRLLLKPSVQPTS